jgi:hypothetical protein|tara:strand:- start:485 stop:655 length:171 start_codon:yes stop_codon:yes gene_type:complete
MAEHDDSVALIDKLEHELHKLEFNQPYNVVEIRKVQTKVHELRTKLAESELAFGQF